MGAFEVGSVPFIKYSDLVDCPSIVAPPPNASIWAAITFAGFMRDSSVFPFRTLPIILFQIGDAPVTPEAIIGFIGLLSLFPTHTPTTNDGVYPTVQLSLLLSVVPVFTETVFPGIFKKEEEPKASLLALLSKSMCEIINAASSLKTFGPFTLFCLNKVFPFKSLTSSTLNGSCLTPLLAKTEYALTSSSKDTSLPPKTRESPTFDKFF
ncbi:MAG: hypothetical protein ACD_37C00027G0001 [uncultured bacterium]|nr:MAG: hypothetical protein ACD_37C00027G0001 [uncultured bacterium]